MVPPTPKPPMTCHTHWGSTNRAVRTVTAVLSEEDLPAAPSTTLGKDTDLASADLLRDVRGDTTSTSDPASSSSSSTSTSTERGSYSGFSTDSSLGRRHRYPKWKHQRQTSRLSSRAKSKLKRLSVPYCPPLPERYAARIVRGEYVSFDKLTITAKKGKISPNKLPGSQGR